MPDMMSTLRGFLGDDADDKIKSAMNMLADSGLLEGGGGKKSSAISNVAEEINESIKVESNEAKSLRSGASPALTPEGLELMGQLRDMFDRVSNTNDSRSNLLISLRPFMRGERQRSIDKLVRVMNIGRLSGLFGR